MTLADAVELECWKTRLCGFIDSIFYFHDALGKLGAPMRVLKFRTMYRQAVHDFRSAAAGGLDEYGKPRNDPRITPIGRVLRKYCIDEVPQFFYNVLWKKDMSMVGSRPKPREYWEAYYTPEQMGAGLEYKPGFIGVQYADLASSFEEVIRKEALYWTRKANAPLRTDISYFLMAARNGFLKGVRSR